MDVTVDEIGFITGVAAALIQLFLVQVRTGGFVDHLKAFGTFAADNSVELIVMVLVGVQKDFIGLDVALQFLLQLNLKCADLRVMFMKATA